MTGIKTVKNNSYAIVRGLERACSRFPDGRTLQEWRKLATGQLSFPHLANRDIPPLLTYLTVDTTGLCDLVCDGMCYYHPAIDARRPSVAIEAVKEAIASASAELDLRVLAFAGKEPLLNSDRFFQLADFAASLPGKRFAIGLVTNGRNLARHWDRMNVLVEAGGLTFLDISLDSGFNEQHDEIRGVRGTFALARAALEQCARNWPDVRVGATSVLRHDNASGLLELFRETSEFNRHFFIAPIQPPPFTSTPPLSWSQIRDFVRGLWRLLQEELRDRELEVTFSLLGLYLGEAEKDGLFDWDEVQEDVNGQCFTEHQVGSSRVQFQMQVLPETGRRAGRILYTGAYLPNTHFVQAANPDRFAVGFIQDTPLPELYKRALAIDCALGAVLASRVNHACRDRSCWSHCFGGLAAAEHSLVSGAPLTCQPNLCLKADPDHENNIARTLSSVNR